MYRLNTSREEIYQIIESLHEEKKRTGVRYADIADELGVSPLSVARWMEHTTIPTTDNFLILCDYFGHKVVVK